MKECKCNLRQRLVGDGCEVCNPQLAAELSKPACDDCGAVEGEPSRIDGSPLRVRMFTGKLLCSDCEDALVFSLEH